MGMKPETQCNSLETMPLSHFERTHTSPVFSFFSATFRYRVSVPVDFIKSQLAFGNDEDWQKFIEPLGLTFADAVEKTKLDCKSSMAALPNLQ